MRCLHCGKQLSVFRKLSDGEFCSDAHRTSFRRQQGDMALARLIESQAPEPQHKTRAQKKAKTEAPALPPVAECLPELAAAIGLTSLHTSVMEPLEVKPEVREPELALALSRAVMPSSGLQAGAAAAASPCRSGPVARDVRPAVPAAAPAPPLACLTVALEEPPEAEAAGPESDGLPSLARTEEPQWEPPALACGLAEAPVTAVSPAVAALRCQYDALLAQELLIRMPALAAGRTGSGFSLAELVRPDGQLAAARPRAQVLPTGGWRKAGTKVALPGLPAALPRATLSEAYPMVLAGVAGACVTPARMPVPARLAAAALLPAAGLCPEREQPRAEVAAAEPAVVEEPAPAGLCEKLWPLQNSRPIPPPANDTGGGPDEVAARWEQVLGCPPVTPCCPHRPDAPGGGSAGGPEAAGNIVAAEVRRRFLPLQENLGRHWRHAPADLKWIGLGVPIVLLLVLYSSISPQLSLRGRKSDDGGVKRALGSTFSSLGQRIAERAAVDLSDDFRSGLGAWTGDGNWAQSWSYNQANFALPGQLALYRPTLPLRDYNLEFLAQIETHGLHWVVRAADTRNYQALSVVLTRTGPLTGATFVRRAVIDGVTEAPVSLPLPTSIRADAVYRVRTEVRGNSFVTYLQGQIVDSFDDKRLEKGGIGFYSPKGDRSMIRWVEVTHQYDFLGRLCAWLAPDGPRGEGRTGE